jgi:hypothetical protein
MEEMMNQPVPVDTQGYPRESATTYRPSRRTALLTAVILAAMFVASAIYAPPGGNYYTICGFKNLTGLPCPGCGLTHSFCSLGKGHFAAGFEYNTLGPVLFLYAILLFARSAFVLVRFDRAAFSLDKVVAASRTIRMLVLLFVVYGVVRVGYLLISGSGTIQGTPIGRLWVMIFG